LDESAFIGDDSQWILPPQEPSAALEKSSIGKLQKAFSINPIDGLARACGDNSGTRFRAPRALA
jgi:hypothetical protein